MSASSLSPTWNLLRISWPLFAFGVCVCRRINENSSSKASTSTRLSLLLLLRFGSHHVITAFPRFLPRPKESESNRRALDLGTSCAVRMPNGHFAHWAGVNSKKFHNNNLVVPRSCRIEGDHDGWAARAALLLDSHSSLRGAKPSFCFARPFEAPRSRVA